MKALRVACVGGGTGLSTLLRGIKRYVAANGDRGSALDMDRLTAIVSVSDDGGSSGRLMDEFGVLPPGDIRNCLVALAAEDEMMASLFEHRFQSNGHLQGHSMGNLLLIALSSQFGSFPRAIQEASRVLAVRGRILPVTLDSTVLCAELADGTIVAGESAIPGRANRSRIQRVFLTRRPINGTKCAGEAHEPNGPIRALPDAVKAIAEADAVLIGPGSLYTSILPNIAVTEIAEAIQNSAAVKIYVGNVMMEPGETDGFSVTDHVAAIREHGGFTLDYVLTNNARASEDIIRQYFVQELREAARSRLDHDDPTTDQLDAVIESELGGVPERIDHSSVQVFYQPGRDDVSPATLCEHDLIHEPDIRERDSVIRVLRHDPAKLAEAIMRILRSHYN